MVKSYEKLLVEQCQALNYMRELIQRMLHLVAQIQVVLAEQQMLISESEALPEDTNNSEPSSNEPPDLDC